MNRFALVLGALGAVALPGRVAQARPASSGFFAEFGAGAAAFIGSSADDAAIGPTMAARIGYEPFSWLAIGVHLEGQNHEATVPAPPVGEWFQLYRGSADLRLTGRIGGFAMFVEGGGGGAYISSNVLQKVGVLDPGERMSLALDAGAGVEYQLQNRHYAFGLAGDWWMFPQYASTQGAGGRLYLRYTY